MQRDLIIATAAGYKFEQIELFLRSLDKHFLGVLLLLTDKKYRLPKYSFEIELGDIKADYFQSSIPFAFNSANNRRLYFAQKYISDNHQFEKIFLTDIRDVVFQENPFEALVNDKLQAAVEDVVIADNEYNSNWIRTLMGEDYYLTVKDKNVLCSGTILGGRKVILYYLDFVTKLLNEKGVHLDTGKNVFIIDQGAFIVFCYSFPQLVNLHTNQNGKIFTMSYIPKMVLNSTGKFVNDEQKLYSIIHQYDRYPFLIDLFKKQNKLFGIQDLKTAVKAFLKNYL
jgi:hypothetical protein